MTECLIMVAWSHRMVKWYQMQLHTLKKAFWTPNNVQNIGVIDNYCLFLKMNCSIHSMPTDCHQAKAKRVPNTVTATDSNLSPVAHEISSRQIHRGLVHGWIFFPTATLSYSVRPDPNYLNPNIHYLQLCVYVHLSISFQYFYRYL